MRVLVIRPQPGAAATAARLAALGHEPLVAPLVASEAVEWALPDAMPDAVMFSSAAAVRLAGRCLPVPALCVGEATAAAATAAGYRAQAGPGTLQGLLDAAAAGPYRRLLHLAGEDRTLAVVPPGLQVAVATVYRARLQRLATLPAVQAVLLHSPRSARHFAGEWDRLGGQRQQLALFAISRAALAAAGDGWGAVAAAPEPNEAALLALLAMPGKAG